jgi:hypothetical protein
MRKLYTSVMAAFVSALVFAGSALAAADPTIESAKTSVTTYFTDNLPVVIAAFIAVAMAIWALSLLFKSVGVRRPSKVG